jgi:broad specificity phosphatase PhoE
VTPIHSSAANPNVSSAATLQALFIRHGQSAANIGAWIGDFAEIPLTPLGEQQAELLAARWDFTPTHIITSPYLRARQTAAPTIARFPTVPVEAWDIYEFTFWDRAHWSPSTPEDAREEVALYWRLADPDRHQAGAESFRDLSNRAEDTLRRLQAFPNPGKVLLFSHGHFMQALRQLLRFPHWTLAERMLNFRTYDETNKVRNAEIITTERRDQSWHLL